MSYRLTLTRHQRSHENQGMFWDRVYRLADELREMEGVIFSSVNVFFYPEDDRMADVESDFATEVDRLQARLSTAY